MSFISKFLDRLRDVTDRSELLEVLHEVNEQVTNSIAPSIEKMSLGGADTYRDVLRTNETFRTLTERSRGRIGQHQTLASLILATAKNLPKFTKLVEGEVNKRLAPKVANKGLSYRQINVLAAVDCVRFFGDYVLSYGLQLVDAFDKRGSSTKFDSEYLLLNLHRFIESCKLINAGLTVKGNIENTLDVTFEESEFASDRSIHGEGVVVSNLIGGTNTNIFYGIGVLINEFRFDRYKVSKDAVVSLQLRLMRLQELNSGGAANPERDKEIQTIEDLLRLHKKRVSDYESKFNK